MKPTVFDLIRSEKVNIVIGPWKTGKIPPAAFPINRPRSIPTGGAWRWRLCEFDALNYHCRVIIRVNFEKQRYHSYLSIDTQKSVKVICHHDLHIGDKGWHCHFAKGLVEDVMEGVLRDKDCYTMFEAEPSLAQSQLFTITDHSALSKAAKRYRFEARGTFI